MSKTSKPEILSRLLDQWRTSDAPEVDAVLAELVDELKLQEQRTRARKVDDEARLQATLKAIVLDLYATSRANPERYIRIGRRKGDYAKLTRYTNDKLSYQPVIDVTDFLRHSGYTDYLKGYYKKEIKTGRRSAHRATSKLMDAFNRHAVALEMIIASSGSELVRLKDENKILTEYDDTNETRAFRDNLVRINKVIADCDISLNMTGTDIGAMQERRLNKQNDKVARKFNSNGTDTLPDIDFTHSTMRRVFNNNIFDQGGRFYGGWWQVISKRYRKNIIIDGEETVELDYRALHPRMLYHLADIELPKDDDAYRIQGFDGRHRDIIKRTFQRLLNAKQSQGMELEPEDLARLPEGKTLADIIHWLIHKHHPIKDRFFSGYGLQLQRMDSDIAEAVMLRLIDQGIPVLPVHDSFIVPSSSEEALRKTMVDCYHDKLGYYPEVDY